MAKRPPSKANARRRKASEDMIDDSAPPPKKSRYNLRERPVKAPQDDALWVDDDTLDTDGEESDGGVRIEIEIRGLNLADSDEESETDEESFLKILQNKYAPAPPSIFPAEKKQTRPPKPKKESDVPPMELTRVERNYYRSLDPAKRKDMLNAMNRISILMDEGVVPYKFKILGLPISDYMKSMVLKKIDALAEMSLDSGGAHKLKTWVDGFLNIPFGKTVPLPVKIDDGIPACTDFMVKARKQMDEHIYGMKSAKTQIMQVLSQWVVNPSAVGNVIALHGPMGVGKCHAKDTEILMYDGSIKLVQDILVGDAIMGDDSTCRKVLSLGRGEDEMYDIVPVKGDKYTVNSEHILCLKQSGIGCVNPVSNKNGTISFKTMRFHNTLKKLQYKTFSEYDTALAYLKSFSEEDMITEISVKDYLNLPNEVRKNWLKGYRKGVSFSPKSVDFDPYIIGLWLGDGTSSKPAISSQDATILGYLHNNLRRYGLMLSYNSQYDYYIRSMDKSLPNALLDALRKYDLINNKHIPDVYKLNDRDVRLGVLAGLIDSDGHLIHGTYEITQKSKRLADDIVYLARSLGFAAYSHSCVKSCMYKGEPRPGTYNRIFISGDICEIPVRVPRKKAPERMQEKNHLVTGIQVNSVGRGDYYGFTLDGNNRYLMGDFTVTHNTSFARNGIASVLQRPFGFFTLGGASDVSNFTGHAYTYEGSTWGRIADTLMQCGTMNPVLYFDELDKISGTAHGEEIASMLIHLTDKSQNTEFHDRYFAGVDFDMSQCLFVFSFNDIEKVHPILRDRMNIIECGGYDDVDKKEILKNYVWPEMTQRLKFKKEDLVFEDEAMKFVISQYSAKEKGVRTLIRTVETVITRLNMLRVSKHESMKEYPFYMDVEFPLQITPKVIQTLLKDSATIKQDETWKMMYT
jgi:hypothetical protein